MEEIGERTTWKDRSKNRKGANDPDWWTPERRAKQGKRLKKRWAKVKEKEESLTRTNEDLYDTEKVKIDNLPLDNKVFLLPRESLDILMNIGDNCNWDVEALNLIKSIVLWTKSGRGDSREC